jgi:hypothetical protein
MDCCQEVKKKKLKFTFFEVLYGGLVASPGEGLRRKKVKNFYRFLVILTTG